MIFKIGLTILKSFFKKPATLMYPKIKRQFFVKSRGKISIVIEECIFCGMCQKKCPASAILVERTKKKWEIDRLSCVSCNACVEVCPKKCLSMENFYAGAQTNRDKDSFVKKI